MEKIVCTRKNRFSLVAFFCFSVVFISPVIPNIYYESKLYGLGYFQSSVFLKTVLSVLPFILITIVVFLMIRRKYILIFDVLGLQDRRFLISKVFYSWECVNFIEIKNEKQNYYLLLNLKNDSGVLLNSTTKTIKISLKGVDYDLKKIYDFLLKINKLKITS